MWTSDAAAARQLLISSGAGTPAVLAALAGLVLLIVLLMGAVRWTRRAKAAGQTPEVSEETCAIVLAVLCEELRAAPEELRITSIRKL